MSDLAVTRAGGGQGRTALLLAVVSVLLYIGGGFTVGGIFWVIGPLVGLGANRYPPLVTDSGRRDRRACPARPSTAQIESCSYPGAGAPAGEPKRRKRCDTTSSAASAGRRSF